MDLQLRCLTRNTSATALCRGLLVILSVLAIELGLLFWAIILITGALLGWDQICRHLLKLIALPGKSKVLRLLRTSTYKVNDFLAAFPSIEALH